MQTVDILNRVMDIWVPHKAQGDGYMDSRQGTKWWIYGFQKRHKLMDLWVPDKAEGDGFLGSRKGTRWWIYGFHTRHKFLEQLSGFSHLTKDALQAICYIPQQTSTYFHNWQSSPKDTQNFQFNSLNAELNPICHLLALLGAHHILHVSRIRVMNTNIFLPIITWNLTINFELLPNFKNNILSFQKRT
jgi:hypothetical protein